MTKRRKTKLEREAETARSYRDYLQKTGFRTLGDALDFHVGKAAPPRPQGIIELPQSKPEPKGGKR